MRILYFSPKPPFPAVDGGSSCAAGDITALLRLGHTVHSFSLATPKHPVRPSEFTHPGLTREYVLARPRLRARALLQDLLKDGGYLARRFWFPAISERLEARLRLFQPDWVVVQGLALGKYLGPIRRATTAGVTLRILDIERDLWRQRCDGLPPPLRLLIGPTLGAWDAFETKVWGQADALACLSPEMAAKINARSCRRFVHVIPPLVEARYDEKIPSDSQLAFLGAMDWWPNREGLDWFLKQVFPLVLRQAPGTKLFLAGKDLPSFSRARRLPPEVVCLGEVPAAGPFMQQHDFFIVPLLSGSGLRIKILEAMALGRVVIATAKAAQGLDCQAGEEILVSGTAQEMASQIAGCRTEPWRVAHVPGRARQCIRRQMAFPVVASAWERLAKEPGGRSK
jgi:glycosyltransferase involved in cell wall biosynthesis